MRGYGAPEEELFHGFHPSDRSGPAVVARMSTSNNRLQENQEHDRRLAAIENAELRLNEMRELNPDLTRDEYTMLVFGILQRLDDELGGELTARLT